MKKQKKKSKAIKDLFLDRPTSHGGWPDGHSGSYRDPNTPVYKQISDYLKSMGLVDDENPRARLAEGKLRKMIRDSLNESFRNMQAQVGDYYVSINDPGELVQIVDYFDIPPEDDRHEIIYYVYENAYGDRRHMKARHFHRRYEKIK